MVKLFNSVLITISYLLLVERFDAAPNDDPESSSNHDNLDDRLDEAKEGATKCRYLIKLASEHLIDSTNQDRRQVLSSALENHLDACYQSMNRIIARKFQQIGSVMSSISADKPTEVMMIQDNSLDEESDSQRIRVNQSVYTYKEYKNLMMTQGFEQGLDYCSQFTTGILAEFANFIEISLFASPSIQSLIPSGSPLRSFEQLEQAYMMQEANLPVFTMLKIARKCRQSNELINLSQAGKLLITLGVQPECKWSNVIVLKRLYQISNRNSRLDLAQVTQELIQSCFRVLNLELYREGITIIWRKKHLVFVEALAGYMRAIDSDLSTNIIDLINPRSLVDNGIEKNLFFNVRTVSKAARSEVNLRQIYQNGKDLCELTTKIDFYSTTSIELQMVGDWLQKLFAIFATNNLQFNLDSTNIDFDLRFFLLWHVCREIQLYDVIVS